MKTREELEIENQQQREEIIGLKAKLELLMTLLPNQVQPQTWMAANICAHTFVTDTVGTRCSKCGMMQFPQTFDITCQNVACAPFPFVGGVVEVANTVYGGVMPQSNLVYRSESSH